MFVQLIKENHILWMLLRNMHIRFRETRNNRNNIKTSIITLKSFEYHRTESYHRNVQNKNIRIYPFDKRSQFETKKKKRRGQIGK